MPMNDIITWEPERPKTTVYLLQCTDCGKVCLSESESGSQPSAERGRCDIDDGDLRMDRERKLAVHNWGYRAELAIPICDGTGPDALPSRPNSPPHFPPRSASGSSIQPTLGGASQPGNLAAVFGDWFPWNSRSQVPGAERPGVYILAHFSPGSIPQGPADPFAEDIVYIGETCDQTLGKRWYQFNRSAFEKKGGHSGGWTYQGVCAELGGDLYVAACPVWLPEPQQSAYIRYLERHLLWVWIQRHGRSPGCNSK